MTGSAYALVASAALLLASSACGPDPGSGPAPGSHKVLSQRLADAAFEGNRQAVEEMLREVDIDATDEGGRTMLMLASYEGHSNTVRLLCENSANPNLMDTNRRTALMYAASGPNAKTVEILLAHGAEVNMTDAEEGWTALMFAAAEGHAEIVEMLLARGADPGLADIDGETAVTFAENNGHKGVVELLRAAHTN